MMTLHAAKGLEFEHVFIVGVEEGLLPHERSNAEHDDEQLEEERRLLFVGMTRAKAGLHISFARYRTIRGQFLRTVPSQFLFELGVAFAEQPRQIQYDDADVDADTGEPPARFRPGQLVRHDIFGLGRVKEFSDMGEDSIVSVKFNSGHTKTLMLKYANLSPVDM